MTGTSDFLAGLLDRAFERTPVLERRRPSLFEPMAEEGPRGTIASVNPARMPEEGIESFAIRDAPVMPPASRVRRPTPQPRLAEKESRIAEEVIPRQQPARSLSEVRERDRTTATTPRAEQPASQSLTRDELPAPPKQESRKEKVHATEAAVQTIEQQPLASTPPALRPKIASEASPPDPPATTPARATAFRPPSLPAAEVRNTAVNPVRAPIQPTILPALRPSLPQQRPQSMIVRRESPAPPTIHVTIGRIEVRATSSPAAPARAPRTSAPKLSLQDYLQSRRGAGK